MILMLCTIYTKLTSFNYSVITREFDLKFDFYGKGFYQYVDSDLYLILSIIY